MRFHKDKTGHWLPILPQGDPHKPRATPSVSVMDIKPEADSKRVKKNALSGGAGLRIEEGEVKDVLQDPNINIVHVSSSRKPVMMSSSSLSDNLDPEDDKEVVNEAGVMPLPNLDKAEDDSNVDHNEVVDDDQNPDGQVKDLFFHECLLLHLQFNSFIIGNSSCNIDVVHFWNRKSLQYQICLIFGD